MAVASRGVGRVGSAGKPGADRRARERGDQGDRGERGPRVCGLSSARDRARLREHELAERARVEQVLARGPIGRELEDQAAPAGTSASVAVAAAPSPVPRRGAACVCRVCGGSDVAVDFVRDRGTWRLARCGRCDFIWTERATEPWSAARVIRCRDASAA